MNAVANAPVFTVTSAAANTTGETPHVFRAAYNATASDRIALPSSKLLSVTLDVPVVTTTVLGALPRLWSLRDAIADTLATFDLATFDKIEVYAKALAYAQTVYLAASTPTEMLPALAARATAMRQQFVTDATALASRGLLDSKNLEELKGGTGYLNVASDLGVLVRMFRERWSDLSTKSPIRLAELDEAETIFERVTLAYAERSRKSEVSIAAAEDRQRAYTLLVNAWDQARRAVTYIRWEQEDVEEYAPSLWSGRSRRASGSSEAEKEEETPANPNGVAPSAPVLVAPAAEPSTPGLPGASPFVNA